MPTTVFWTDYVATRWYRCGARRLCLHVGVRLSSSSCVLHQRQDRHTLRRMPTFASNRAPELCGSFFAKYSPAIDTWSVGCIFAGAWVF